MPDISEGASGRNTHPKRRNRISGQFSAHLIEMRESPAWRVLSLSARRVLDRIEIELAHHGGNDNGRLPVTFHDFVEYGVHRDAIAPAIREAEALGFLQITERGRGGNAEHRKPSLYLLTFVHARTTRDKPPSHDWRRIKTVTEACEIAEAARRNKSGVAAERGRERAKKTKNRPRKPGPEPTPETRTGTADFPTPETMTTASVRNPGLLSISRVRGEPPGPPPSALQFSPPEAPYASLPVELRLMALWLPWAVENAVGAPSEHRAAAA